MNLTYVRIELARCFRDVSNLMFTFALPVAMYLLFGKAEYSGLQVGRGTVGFYVMASMGAYGAVIAATAISAQAATESMLGWGRPLALTRQRPLGFVANKALTGAKADVWWVWVTTWGIAILGAVLFGIFGLAMALLLRSESASSIASGAMVFLAFFGNVFIPLEGVMLDIAKFTPMYGYVGRVRYPQLEGEIIRVNPPQTDSVWVLSGNYLAWLLVFTGLAVLGQRRSRKRQ